jgi:hypothetical protein
MLMGTQNSRRTKRSPAEGSSFSSDQLMMLLPVLTCSDRCLGKTICATHILTFPPILKHSAMSVGIKSGSSTTGCCLERARLRHLSLPSSFCVAWLVSGSKAIAATSTAAPGFLPSSAIFPSSLPRHVSDGLLPVWLGFSCLAEGG